jgi:hypothetical protein
MKRIFPVKTPYEHGYNAFIGNDECVYRIGSFYEREWHRGWNTAYSQNKERHSA